MKKTKQVMALLLALVMVVSMMPSNVQFVAATAAEDKIELGDETWSADGQAYTFSDVTVSFKSDQKIFCISVDNGGYFKLPKKIDLGNMSSSSDRMNGLTKSGEYTSSLSGDEELSSMTVIGSDITDEQIKNFLTRLFFIRERLIRQLSRRFPLSPTPAACRMVIQRLWQLMVNYTFINM